MSSVAGIAMMPGVEMTGTHIFCMISSVFVSFCHDARWVSMIWIDHVPIG